MAATLCGSAVLAMTIGSAAQQPAPQGPPQAQGGRGGGRGVSPALFTATDTNKDGTVTRGEFKTTLRYMVHAVGCGRQRVGHAGPGHGGADCGASTPRWWWRPGCTRAESDAERQSDVAAMMAALPDKAPATPRAAQGARSRQGCGVRPLVDPAGGAHGRRARQEDRRLVDDDHLRPRRHQRAEPEAVRRGVPRQHHRRLPRRPQRCGGHGRLVERRCSNSCAAAKAWRGFTRPPTPIIGATRPRVSRAESGGGAFGGGGDSAGAAEPAQRSAP